MDQNCKPDFYMYFHFVADTRLLCHMMLYTVPLDTRVQNKSLLFFNVLLFLTEANNNSKPYTLM